MTVRLGWWCRAVALAVMVAAAGAGLVSPRLLLAEAQTRPVSQRVVAGVVTLPDGQEMRFKTLEGGLVSFKDQATGRVFGFSPILRKSGAAFEVTVFEISQITPGNDRIQQIDRFEVASGGSGSSKAARPFQVRIEEVPGVEIEAAANGARTRAASHRILAGTVILPSGTEVGFKSVEGELVTFQDAESGKTYGLTPVCVGDEQQITLFEITDVGPGNQKIRQIEKLKLPAGATGESEAIDGLRFTLAKPVAPRASQEKENRCCVTCGSTTACACAASLDCGSCCSGPCCEPENRVE